MIQKCLIRREMTKKNWRRMAFFGGNGGTSAVFFSKLVKKFVKRRLFSFLTYVLRLKPSLKITDYIKVAKLPPSLNEDYMQINMIFQRSALALAATVNGTASAITY